ncbi:MAG: carbohydrate binding domain-containing protein, partial [Planctomycetota bacterium]
MRARVVWLTAFFLIGFMGFGLSQGQEVVNLLPNGGFETGDMSPWTIYGGNTSEVVTELTGAAVPEDPIEGTYALHIVVPAAGVNSWSVGLQNSDHVFENGKKYTVSAFLKSKSGDLQIRFKPELGVDPWTGYGDQVFTMTEEWTEFSVTTPVMTAEVNPADITFHISFTAGDFWIDGARWYEGDYVEPYLGDKSLASKPVPEDGALHADTWVNLSWKPGDFALSHDVYFGDNFDDVNDGAAEAFRGNQASNYFVAGFPGFPYPDGLIPGTTYYWRIDEVNDLDPNSPWKGDVWSFGIPPKTAYAPDPADAAEQVNPGVTLRWTEGFGSKLHTVYFGENFDDVNNAAGGLPQGTLTYTPGPLKLAKTYYWRVDEFDIIETYKGDVWSFTTQGAVGSPDPANGAVDVKQTQIITFSPSVFAASHQLYFGTDKDAVKNADTSSPEYKGTKALGAESYDPGKLELDATYYWRIDEVNNASPDSPWPGILWSFTTAGFLVVDDFEDYDSGDNQIWYSWKDGLGYAAHGNEPAYPGNGTGSAVGDENTASFTEETIVHGGNQSMPFWYDNSILKYSEVEKTLTYPRDWTEEGVGVLSTWFRGDADNAAEPMYVALNGSAIVTNDNPNAAQIDTWTQWN